MSRFEKLSQENNKPKAEASEEIFMTKSEIEALREEAEQIERELKEDPFIDSMDPPKELYNKIVQELKDKGIYHEDEDEVSEEKEEVVEKKKKVVFYSRWKRAGKCAAIVCLTMLGVFGVAMTSEANRVYLISQVESWLGTDSNLKINNSGIHQDGDLSEFEAKQVIENTLNIKAPRLIFIPEGMSFSSYSVDEESCIALMQYTYEDHIISLYMSNSQNESAEFSAYDGVKLESPITNANHVNVEIWEIKDERDVQPNYVAKWEYKNCYYELSGKLDIETFTKIIQEITF